MDLYESILTLCGSCLGLLGVDFRFSKQLGPQEVGVGRWWVSDNRILSFRSQYLSLGIDFIPPWIDFVPEGVDFFCIVGLLLGPFESGFFVWGFKFG